MAKRIGLMGCGTVAGYGHLPALDQCPDLELYSLYDPDEDNLRRQQERFGLANAFTDVDQFFASGIDAVSITSPAPCHLQNVIDAAKHGKHVLCEKPLAMTEAESQEMIDTAARAGIMLFTAFVARFNPVSKQIRSLVRDGAIGEVRSLRLIYIWNCHGMYETGPDGQPIIQARRAGRMLEGGPLVDCGVHDIDLARWWLGSEVAKWTATGAWVEDYEAPDHIYLHMDHDNGAHTMVEISYTFTHTAADPIYHLTYHLIGTEGLIRHEMENNLLEVRNSTGTQQLECTGAKNFDDMYAAFARALEKGSSDELPTGEDGLEATRIARTATEEAIARRRS
ncbi:MAG: Gfo/Idh/MocA family oxidoreductase [Gemmatimonadetes bacterium]|jgi:predicted dehydrogenase|nr:Gfo/Idh/MocA family oxidoreductase [Gemmatimonadota bacterium]